MSSVLLGWLLIGAVFALGVFSSVSVAYSRYRARRMRIDRLATLYDREAVRRRNAIPPPELRPDFRDAVPQQRRCPDCGVAFERNPTVVELRCNACVAKRFEASEQADIEEWRRKGWN